MLTDCLSFVVGNLLVSVKGGRGGEGKVTENGLNELCGGGAGGGRSSYWIANRLMFRH